MQNIFKPVTISEANDSRMDQVKFFKGCISQTLLGPFLNTSSHQLLDKPSCRNDLKFKRLFINVLYFVCWYSWCHNFRNWCNGSKHKRLNVSKTDHDFSSNETFLNLSLRGKCPNTEFFLVRVFPYSIRIRIFTDTFHSVSERLDF